MNLANQLTVWRMVLATAVFLALIRPSPYAHLAAFVMFLAALATDWIDGRVARATHTISSFGKVADPIADKILILGVLIALTRLHLNVPLWGIFLILVRELLVGGLRTLASAHGKVPAAAQWGKWKMGFQSAAVGVILAILILKDFFHSTPAWLFETPYYLTVLCVIAAWHSAYLYYRESHRLLEKTWS
jgi:CDP-diacylglycerol--glycerol-3-phosphate 3-phosphatidyltransferase